MHHAKVDVSRINITRKEGGRGMTNFEMAYKTTAIGLIFTCSLQEIGCCMMFYISKRGRTFTQW